MQTDKKGDKIKRNQLKFRGKFANKEGKNKFSTRFQKKSKSAVEVAPVEMESEPTQDANVASDESTEAKTQKHTPNLKNKLPYPAQNLNFTQNPNQNPNLNLKQINNIKTSSHKATYNI